MFVVKLTSFRSQVQTCPSHNPKTADVFVSFWHLKPVLTSIFFRGIKTSHLGISCGENPQLLHFCLTEISQLDLIYKIKS